jgi:formylglycine-generating enzyme required for sulfatase activity
MKFQRAVSSLLWLVLLSACGGTGSVSEVSQHPPPCTTIRQTWKAPQDDVTLVCVPAGKFQMGAAEVDPLARDDEKPQHQVYLDAYWIDQTEVSNAAFARCLEAGVCKPEVYETTAQTFTPYAVHPDYQNYPAFLYEAEAAAAYCNWVERRLPTEAEWEKAARGTDERRFPWGNELDCAHATYFECLTAAAEATASPTGPRCGYSSFCRTVPVEAHPAGASPYGALNLAGNVWEWVADWYASDYYATAPITNPIGPAAGEYRVRRGGGARSLSADLRVTARAGSSVSHFFDSQIGFRCAVTALP